ncbi:hypothetical protein BKA80DRAFT_125620 [Phyllosticta citrichinensis]
MSCLVADNAMEFSIFLRSELPLSCPASLLSLHSLLLVPNAARRVQIGTAGQQASSHAQSSTVLYLSPVSLLRRIQSFLFIPNHCSCGESPLAPSSLSPSLCHLPSILAAVPRSIHSHATHPVSPSLHVGQRRIGSNEFVLVFRPDTSRQSLPTPMNRQRIQPPSPLSERPCERRRLTVVCQSAASPVMLLPFEPVSPRTRR